MAEPPLFKCQMSGTGVFFRQCEGDPERGVLCGAISSSIMMMPNSDDKPAVARPVAVMVALVACAAAIASEPAAPGEGTCEAVAISSRASSDYVRARLPDGSYQRETFAFANGGEWRGAQAGTKGMPGFMDVARVVARPLASQGYLSSTDPRSTRLLIMVYWGTTRTPEHTTDSAANQNLQLANAAALAASNTPQIVRFNPGDTCAPLQMAQSSTASYAVRTPEQIDQDNALSGAMAAAAAEDNQRTQLDALNANMLGYDSWWTETAQYAGTPLEYRRRDLMDELESRRYFVVLLAYDFQKMWKEKKATLLWETRFSVREQGKDFSSVLGAMAATASSYFGRNSGKLIHTTAPEGRVEVGTIKELAFSPTD